MSSRSSRKRARSNQRSFVSSLRPFLAVCSCVVVGIEGFSPSSKPCESLKTCIQVPRKSQSIIPPSTPRDLRSPQPQKWCLFSSQSASSTSTSVVDLATQPTDLSTASVFRKKRSMSELAGLYIIGFSLLATIVYTLASSMGTKVIETSPGGRLVFVSEAAEELGSNILEAAFPLTATDAVTGALGEATAGIAAAFSSLILSSFLSNMMKRPEKLNTPDQGDPLLVATNDPQIMNLKQQVIEQQGKLQSRDLGRKAIANGDFFVAQAAALPLLESVGLPPSFATLAAVLLAAVPAEIVNVLGRQRIEKDRRMLEFIIDQEEETRKSLEKPFPLNLIFPLQAEELAEELRKKRERTMQPDSSLMNEGLWVEIISDLIKWLSYGVLSTDFQGMMTYNGLPLFPGLESAWYGVIAGLCAQIYADTFSTVFGFGGQTKRQEVLSRSLLKWVATYLLEAVSAGVLFGVYEFAQIPATAVVSAVLSGAADNCSGSQDFNLCMETYLVYNPPGASPEAQLRSLVTTIVSLLNKYSPDSFYPIDAFF